MNGELNKRIGCRVKELREKAGLTQSELAQAMGYRSRVSIVSIEAGTKNCSIENIEKLLSIFQMQIRDFFDFEFPGNKVVAAYLPKSKLTTKLEIVNENNELMRENARLKTLLLQHLFSTVENCTEA